MRSNSDRKYWIAARSPEEAATKAFTELSATSREDVIVKQDEDVLDTWFSSALLPFSVFGWPEKVSEVLQGLLLSFNGFSFWCDSLDA